MQRKAGVVRMPSLNENAVVAIHPLRIGDLESVEHL